VPWFTGAQPAPAWIYSRQTDTVRIEVRDHGSRFGLVVTGPGSRRRFLECADAWDVIQRQIAEEAHLLVLGYVLDRFTADRRSRPDRSWGQPVRVAKNKSR
jgi:hypothetical protein